MKKIVRMFKRANYFLPDMHGCWILFFLLILGQFLPVLLLLPFDSGKTWTSAWGGALLYAVGFLPLLLYAWYQGGKAMAEHLPGLPVDVDSPCFGRIRPVLFFLLLITAFFSLVLVLDPLTGAVETPEWFREASEDVYGDSIFWAFVKIAVFAPLFEEFLCRGLILRGLLHRMGPFMAILWSSLMFGLMHLNVWQAVPAICFGCFFGWIYYRTRSFWTVVFLHFLNNATGLLVHFTRPDLDFGSLRILFPRLWMYCSAISVAALLFCAIVYLIAKNIPEKRYDKETLSA